ncbi:hypothetical protein DsansV1_C01g0002781 [Dioscorea sansibarensis]
MLMAASKHVFLRCRLENVAFIPSVVDLDTGGTGGVKTDNTSCSVHCSEIASAIILEPIS